MLAAAIEIIGLGQQLFVAQARDALMPWRDGEMQPAVEHATLEIARRQDLDRDVDRIVAAIEAVDGGRRAGIPDG